MKKALMIVLILLLAFVGGKEFLNNPSSSSSYNISSEEKKPSSKIGYLKKGASWQDETGKAYYNREKVKVEIKWTPKLVTETGGDLIQIYFLEGDYSGRWGYVREISLSQ